MKHTLLLKFSMMILLLAAALPVSFGFVVEVNHTCALGECIEGKQTDWNVTIHNQGGKFLEILGVDIVDAVTNEVDATFKTSFYPQFEQRGDVILLNARNSLHLTVSGPQPPANYITGEYVYYPCVTTVVREPLEVARTGEYERKHCYAQNFSLVSYGCLDSTHCSADYACVDQVCEKLQCESCQYIEDHMCHSYECCLNTDCSSNQQCVENTCESIFCSPTQYLFNRTCVDLDCGPDEFIDNKQCKKLDCSPLEYASNHTCKPLMCATNEYIDDHQCVALDCAFNEYVSNHTCLPLLCRDVEAYVDHECALLDCWFFQDAANHQCNTNYGLVGKLVAELLVLIGIIWFLIADWKRHKQKVIQKKREEEKQKKQETAENAEPTQTDTDNSPAEINASDTQPSTESSSEQNNFTEEQKSDTSDKKEPESTESEKKSP